MPTCEHDADWRIRNIYLLASSKLAQREENCNSLVNVYIVFPETANVNIKQEEAAVDLTFTVATAVHTGQYFNSAVTFYDPISKRSSGVYPDSDTWVINAP